MEISFIRHGRSLQVEDHPISSIEYRRWVKKYDDFGVFAETSYPPETIEKILNANQILTSDLQRAIASATHVNRLKITVHSRLFREVGIPFPTSTLWGLKLKPGTWTMILRCLWFCGYSNECESFSQAKKRAKKAAATLHTSAQNNGSVVLVGHGFMNLLISKELQKIGWKGNKPSSKHWQCTSYYFPNSF